MGTPPTTIGRYRIVERIGQGGMGTLFLAIDPSLDRQVAIKLLREAAESDDVRERFVREARAAANLRHQNIIAIFDVGEHDGHPFIAMEYVPGETLADLIRRRAPLSVNRKIEIVEAICAALAHAHERGTVHRDIKPANVMIDKDGTVKVLDFGVARTSGSGLTQHGTLIGSLSYMSPEQVEGRVADNRSDIFSVGVVFYELLSLQAAFAAPDMSGLLAKILQGAPEPLERVVPGIGSDIVAVVTRAIARDPASRYQNLGDMRRDLERIRLRLPDDIHLEPATGASMPGAATVSGVRRADTIVGSVPHEVAPAPQRVVSDTLYLAPSGDTSAIDDGMPEVQLLVVRSSDARVNGRVVPVTAASFSIGRGAACNLSVADKLLSRQHASIEFVAGGFVVRDAGSSNGTFLNGRRVKAGTSEPLYFGATIQLGETALTFTMARDVTLPDLAGRLIGGRYELTLLIRDGARGAVYAALDRKVAKRIAIKVMSPDFMRLQAYRDQFEREAAIGATLHHPHICQVLDRGEDETPQPSGGALRLTYLCLEMMAGGSLQDRLRDDSAPLAQVATWVQRIAEALEYAHRHGIVHGDVKPSAIVFDEDGHVYLTDFAFAQQVLNAGAGPTLGSPPYIAPEIWEHGSVTAHTDQFALAVVAYHLIAGTLPFVGQENPVLRRKNFALGALPAHREAASYRKEAVPAQVSEVLRRALALTPEQRFASTVEFATALAAALEGRRADRGVATIFLSYQRDISSGWANYFAKELKDHDIATFLDVQRVDHAQQFPPRLSRAIEECDVFVCLLGATTLESAWVIEEIRQAHRSNKPMIPIFQESFDPAAARTRVDAAVEALLSYDAVHLFDLRNVHVHHSAADLALLVKNTVSRQR